MVLRNNNNMAFWPEKSESEKIGKNVIFNIRRVSINKLVRVHCPPLFKIEKPDNCEGGGAALS